MSMPVPPNDKVEQTDITDIKLDSLLDKIAEDVSKSIQHQLDDEELSAVHDLICYQPSTGGKRLRPALAVLMGQALGGDYEQIIELATTAELLHNSSLVMDDVLDGDLVRRGKPTAHAMFGAGTAMMGGNILALLAFKLGGRRGFPILNSLVGTASNLALGSTEEFLFHEYNEERYLRIIGLKTASLFKAPCEIGAVVAGAARPEYEIAMKYGWSAGMLYQLTDDLVDILKTHNTGEPAGHMKNGTPTLAFIHAYTQLNSRPPVMRARGDTDMLALLDKFLKSPPLTRQEFEMVYEALLELGSIDYTNSRIEDYNKACHTCCTQLPVSRSRDYLAAMPRYMYRKQMAEAGNPIV
jgi:geranylgeranyl pyrophosphate synthase